MHDDASPPRLKPGAWHPLSLAAKRIPTETCLSFCLSVTRCTVRHTDFYSGSRQKSSILRFTSNLRDYQTIFLYLDFFLHVDFGMKPLWERVEAP